ncbi:MAG TPA: protocatechuate 3,4-dioxygenase subunit alpha [Chitinophagaceae bacterium]|jgi:protocatechuate 3,4-dioxygenase alpha subunit
MRENKLLQTPSQTVGPYFAYGLTSQQYRYDHAQVADGNLIKDNNNHGECITIKGQVLDGEGNFIPDAMIEIWQANAEGNYNVCDFKGFGRQGTGTDKNGYFIFETVKPGSVNEAAPHINVIVFMRGLLSHVYTRIYFSDEAAANQKDEVLRSVDEKRRATLIAKRSEKNGVEYIFNIRMQGENETVFFDV